MHTITYNLRPQPDPLLGQIADYILADLQPSEEAVATARLCLMDALGCAMAALAFPACTKILGPLTPGTVTNNGARVPGTAFQLDPVKAAFDFGAMIRWLDYNDTWLAAEWGHPSDNLGGILMTADWLSRQTAVTLHKTLTIHEILVAMIKAYEIQGVLALENSFNRHGLDHVLLVRVATTAVIAGLLGCTREEIINAVSNAFVDGGALRTYRHSPNTGSRKSWAAGDASSRGVLLAWLASRGEMGYPSAISASQWGFSDVLLDGQAITTSRPFGWYVMENILFKVAFPAEFHAQTAVEAALQIHPLVKDRINEVESITIITQESAMRIIDKQGPLHNPSDRDHCIQYMTAVPLLFGDLTARHYEDEVASDPRIDALRERMVCVESPEFSVDYLDPEKRSIANGLLVRFSDGSSLGPVMVEYPLGHRKRRAEATPLLKEKFKTNLSGRFASKQINAILNLFERPADLDCTPVTNLVDLFVV